MAVAAFQTFPVSLTLTLLRITGQTFYIMALYLNLSDVFLINRLRLPVSERKAKMTKCHVFILRG